MPTRPASACHRPRFDLWERVNNNDGTWQPQIIYAVQDRVLHGDQLFEALHVHQAQPGQAPPDHPGLWQPLPTTAKEQLVTFCDPGDPEQAGFFDVGANGTEEDAGRSSGRRSRCATASTPCPVPASPRARCTSCWPTGREFRPEPTPGTAFYETMSELRTIRLPDFLQSGQTVTVNGRTMRPGVNYPLPPQRNEELHHQDHQRGDLHRPLAQRRPTTRSGQPPMTGTRKLPPVPLSEAGPDNATTPARPDERARQGVPIGDRCT